jgi:hypothetical protein
MTFSDAPSIDPNRRRAERLEIARKLYEALVAQDPDRVIILCDNDWRVVARTNCGLSRALQVTPGISRGITCWINRPQRCTQAAGGKIADEVGRYNRRTGLYQSCTSVSFREIQFAFRFNTGSIRQFVGIAPEIFSLYGGREDAMGSDGSHVRIRH